jgi:hypothetical protein
MINESLTIYRWYFKNFSVNLCNKLKIMNNPEFDSELGSQAFEDAVAEILDKTGFTWHDYMSERIGELYGECFTPKQVAKKISDDICEKCQGEGCSECEGEGHF